MGRTRQRKEGVTGGQGAVSGRHNTARRPPRPPRPRLIVARRALLRPSVFSAHIESSISPVAPTRAVPREINLSQLPYESVVPFWGGRTCTESFDHHMWMGAICVFMMKRTGFCHCTLQKRFFLVTCNRILPYCNTT